MIKGRDFDLMVLGAGHWQNLLAYVFQKKVKRVVHIEDQDLSWGHNQTEFLGQIEKKFLQLWGEKENLAPLLNIDRHLHPVEGRYYINQRQLFFGPSIVLNIKELWRHFPFLFGNWTCSQDAPKLAQEIEELCQFWPTQVFLEHKKTFALDGGASKWVQKFPLLMELASTILKRLPEHETTANAELKDLYTFFTAVSATHLHAFYLQDFSPSMIYLLAQIFSPRYELNVENFMKELRDHFTQDGGHFRTTNIVDWQIFKNRPASILLKSFEGVIHPRQIFILGGPLNQLPFCLNKTTTASSGQAWSFKENTGQIPWPGLKAAGSGKGQGHRVQLIIAHYNSLGTSLPMVLGKIKGTELIVCAPIDSQVKQSPRLRGLITQEVSKFMQHFFQQHAPQLSKLDWQVTPIETPLAFLGPMLNGQKFSSRELLPRPVYEYRSPKRGDRIQGIHYVGPEEVGFLGQLGLLKSLQLISASKN